MLKRRKISKSRFIIICSLLLIFIGIFFVSFRFIKNLNTNHKEEQLIEVFFEGEISEEVQTEVDEAVSETKEETIDYDYIAILEINSINLQRGLVSPDSKYNNVKYNIQIINESTMPDVANGNFILASHNGNSNVSFFNNLYKLKNNDEIVVYYNGIKYIYEYSYSYEVDKTGTVSILRDNNKSAITLITCKKNSKDKQVVFIGYLKNKVEY